MDKTPTSQDAKWYVGYTYPKYERRVDARMQELGVHSFLPLKRELRQWSDRKKLVEAPLFPSYIFVKSRLNSLSELLKVDGLRGFISFANQYATVREHEIDTIKSVLTKSSKENRLQAGPVPITKGSKVEITQGPFRGLQGEVFGKGGKYSVLIRIDSIGQGITLEIAPQYLIH